MSDKTGGITRLAGVSLGGFSLLSRMEGSTLDTMGMVLPSRRVVKSPF